MELVKVRAGLAARSLRFRVIGYIPLERTSILTHMVKNSVIGMTTDTRHHEWICLVGGVSRSVASYTSGIPVSHLDILREGYIRPVASAFAEDEIEIAVGIGAVDGMDPVGDGYGMVVRLIVACQTLIGVKHHRVPLVMERRRSGAVTIDTGSSGHLLFNCSRADLDGGEGSRFDVVIAGSHPAVIADSDTHHVGTGCHACRDRQQLVAESGDVAGDLGIGAEYKQVVTLGRRVRCADEVRIGNRTRGQYRHGLGAWTVHIQAGDSQAAAGVPGDVLLCGVE